MNLEHGGQCRWGEIRTVSNRDIRALIERVAEVADCPFLTRRPGYLRDQGLIPSRLSFLKYRGNTRLSDISHVGDVGIFGIYGPRETARLYEDARSREWGVQLRKPHGICADAGAHLCRSARTARALKEEDLLADGVGGARPQVVYTTITRWAAPFRGSPARDSGKSAQIATSWAVSPLRYIKNVRKLRRKRTGS